MRTIPCHTYNGYTVAINPAGTDAGKYTDAYSIHKGKDGMDISAVTIVEQRSISAAQRFDSEEAAIKSATELSHAWIDVHPV